MFFTVLLRYVKRVARRRFKQVPISLSWALTTWIAQGLIYRHNVYAVIGDHEKATGLTYVILSRNTDIKQLCIGDGIVLERLTAIPYHKRIKSS
jgi:hypothetical protein